MATLAELRARVNNAQKTSNNFDNSTIFQFSSLKAGDEIRIRFIPDADATNDWFWRIRSTRKIPFNSIRLANGTIVNVIGEQNGWSKIGEGQWVSSKYLIATNESVNVSINVGDIVKVKQSATNYVTGQKIPSWVKNNKYKVIQKANGKCLLDSIMSWVYERDLTK